MGITEERKQSLLTHAARWEQLAQDVEAMAVLDAKYNNSAIHHLHAKTYRDTAQSLRLEAETGIGHCSCCLLPYDKCKRHAIQTKPEKGRW